MLENKSKFNVHSLLAATIVMMMDEDVDELCTSTVTRIPMIKPVIGLLRKDSSEKISPAVLPAEEHSGTCFLLKSDGRQRAAPVWRGCRAIKVCVGNAGAFFRVCFDFDAHSHAHRERGLFSQARRGEWVRDGRGKLSPRIWKASPRRLMEQMKM